MSDPKDFQNANIIPGTNQLLKEYIEAKSNNNNDDYQETSQQLRERMIEILFWAIKQLYTNDIKLFKLNKEETLSSRIAHYIECQLREGDYYGYYADVEYSISEVEELHGVKGKKYVDIFVNSRNYYSNDKDILMAIEVKRENETRGEITDRIRLRKLLQKRGSGKSIYGTLMGVFLRLKEKEDSTVDLYFYESIEDNAPIKTKIITYKEETDYNPQKGEEREYKKTTSSNNKRQKQHSTKRTTNNR